VEDAGLSLAYLGLELFIRLAPDIPRLRTTMDAPVFIFSAALTLGTGSSSGIMPALYSSKWIAGSLGNRVKPVTAKFWRARLRSVLVMAEMALAVMLLTEPVCCSGVSYTCSKSIWVQRESAALIAREVIRLAQAVFFTPDLWLSVGVEPGSTCCTCTKLRSSKQAPVSSITASAISAITRTLRRRARQNWRSTGYPIP